MRPVLGLPGIDLSALEGVGVSGEMVRVSESVVNADASSCGSKSMGSLGAQGLSRMCMSCGRSIEWDTRFCPFCSWDVDSGGGVVVPHQISPGKRALLYTASLLVPLFGIILGAMYMSKRSEEHRSVGTACLIMGVVSLFLMPTVLSAVLYVFVLGVL